MTAITINYSRDGPVIYNGEHIGYTEDYTLYMNGRRIGEFNNYAELVRMIAAERRDASARFQKK